MLSGVVNMNSRGSYEGYVYMRGESALQRKKEGRMIRNFVEKNVLKGQFIEEFPLLKENNQRDRIDAICVEEVKEGFTIGENPIFFRASAKKLTLNEVARGKKGDVIWIIEAKTKADKIKEALGQVLIYADLFSREHPQYNLKKAIICPKTVNVYEEICKKFGTKVFVV